uniref:Homing endonuclease LAGLIDADG domain-containing protein n=1 Tax=Caulerpa verticillata TaxID=177082 RepID=A0A386B099_9CHLO|nr:hypothetical protein [Caulerpa verticillata]AYC65117.1 hypothetical protein [Caulerpa verticillata]
MNFQTRYQKILDQFDQVSPQITTKYKYFLAGFIEGEGSCCIFIKMRKNQSIRIDPEFNISQHRDGIVHLIACMNLFKTGNICFKTASRNTFVFKITNRTALQEKLIPYYKKYVLPYTCKHKKYSFQLFVSIINLLQQKVHLNPENFALKILPLVYQMNLHKGKSRKWS